MIKQLIRLTGLIVSETCRTYHYEVINSSGESGETRQFHVRISLELFRNSPLKYQDGPLLTREHLEAQLDRESQGAPAGSPLNVTVPDIQGYMERHYPPKARNWNGYKTLRERS